MKKVVVSGLADGSVIVVNTMNSEYRLTVTDVLNRRAEVSAKIYSGTVDIMNEVIRVGGGLMLGIVSDGRLIRTSLIKAIRVEAPAE